MLFFSFFNTSFCKVFQLSSASFTDLKFTWQELWEKSIDLRPQKLRSKTKTNINIEGKSFSCNAFTQQDLHLELGLCFKKIALHKNQGMKVIKIGKKCIGGLCLPFGQLQNRKEGTGGGERKEEHKVGKCSEKERREDGEMARKTETKEGNRREEEKMRSRRK